ncbi:MAG: ATP-binding protein [Planctomycetes bacterium]|nr:ATP-binding protein [Planctomycetota bacterium]
MPLSPEAIQVLRDLNPWWEDPRVVRPVPPPYRRPLVREIGRRMAQPKGLVEVIRGPRQVGKSTGLLQIVEDLLHSGTPGGDILMIRFDLELLREEPHAIRSILQWHAKEIRKRPLQAGSPGYLFLDEIHKLKRWNEEIKHLGDTFPLRMLLTGSSSVLVARGGRESLAGRILTTELPTFSFREVLQSWKPELAVALPPPLRFDAVFEGGLQDVNSALERLKPQQRLAIARVLERYYNRGGYPRLYGGEVKDDRWADYLVQTVFDAVLGTDIPDLFPVENPQLLRHLYLTVARLTATVIPQNRLPDLAAQAGIPTNQPTAGKYLHYLADALLIREFRRYPLAKKSSARVPAKITVGDLGVRNALFRGAPSLAESDPAVLGPLVETLVQTVIRGPNLQVHYYRDHADPADPRSPLREVDFVAERMDGTVVPVEVKFRRKIDPEDTSGVRHFMGKFKSPFGVVVTRDLTHWAPGGRILCIPLQNFLLAF